jgi:DNA processing protein
MSLREQLLRAGVPKHATEGEVDIDHVLRNIDMASSTRTAVRVEGHRVVFETVVGERRRVEIPVSELWKPSHGRPLNGEDLRRRLAPLRRATGDDISDDEIAAAGGLGRTVGIDLDTLAAAFLLEAIKGFGPQKFKVLYESGVSPSDVACRPELLPIRGKRGDSLRQQLASLTTDDLALARRRAARQLLRARENNAQILTYGHRLYPPNVRESNNPIPILYARGALDVLTERRAVACVGSRNIRPPYSELHRMFAETAIESGYTIVSGFAVGADTIGHEAALRSKGRTIAVMPCGLDRPFPPENRDLWDALLTVGDAAFVSEFPFGTAASSLTLRKRNKLIVAFTLGVLVSQSSRTGGAMNAYRFALEQGKRVATFADDGEVDTSGNRQIAEEVGRQAPALPGPPSQEFPRRPELERWRTWLHELSSST